MADHPALNVLPDQALLKFATLLQFFLIKSKGRLMFATLMQIKSIVYAF